MVSIILIFISEFRSRRLSIGSYFLLRLYNILSFLHLNVLAWGILRWSSGWDSPLSLPEPRADPWLGN